MPFFTVNHPPHYMHAFFITSYNLLNAPIRNWHVRTYCPCCTVSIIARTCFGWFCGAVLLLHLFNASFRAEPTICLALLFLGGSVLLKCKGRTLAGGGRLGNIINVQAGDTGKKNSCDHPPPNSEKHNYVRFGCAEKPFCGSTLAT